MRENRPDGRRSPPHELFAMSMDSRISCFEVIGISEQYPGETLSSRSLQGFDDINTFEFTQTNPSVHPIPGESTLLKPRI